MPEPPIWTLDFMGEEALTLAGSYSPGAEPFSALCRAADALREAAAAVRRFEARNALGAGVFGVIEASGRVRFYERRTDGR